MEKKELNKMIFAFFFAGIVAGFFGQFFLAVILFFAAAIFLFRKGELFPPVFLFSVLGMGVGSILFSFFKWVAF